jgi:hypothetical protein
VGSFPIGSGVGGARNLGEGGGVDDVWVGGVDAVGVGVAIDGDCGGAGNVGDISIVERGGARDGRGECTTFSMMVVSGEWSGDWVGQERGERCSSPSSSSLLSNSTSHLRFAAFPVRLAGGEIIFDVSAISAVVGSTRGLGVAAGACSYGEGNCRGGGGSVELDSRVALSRTAALEAGSGKFLLADLGAAATAMAAMLR